MLAGSSLYITAVLASCPQEESPTLSLFWDSFHGINNRSSPIRFYLPLWNLVLVPLRHPSTRLLYSADNLKMSSTAHVCITNCHDWSILLGCWACDCCAAGGNNWGKSGTVKAGEHVRLHPRHQAEFGVIHIGSGRIRTICDGILVTKEKDG